MFKRIFTSVIRKPIQNLLIFFIVLLLGNSFIGGLSLHKTIETTRTNISESLGAIATIKGESFYETHQSTKTYYNAYNEYKNLVNQCSKDQSVKFSSINNMLEFVNFNHVAGSKTEILGAHEFDYKSAYYVFDSNYSIDLIGTNTSELVDEIAGHIKLTKGRYLTQDEIDNFSNVAIIHEGLVNDNGEEIKIGDTIQLQGNVTGPDYIREDLNKRGYECPVLEVKVVGMYVVLNKKYNVPPYEYSSRVYTPYQLVENYSNEIVKSLEKELGVEDLMQVESKDYFPYFLPVTILPPYYELNSYDDIDSFKESSEKFLAQTTYIKDHYEIIATSDTADRIIEPLNSLDEIANMILYITFIALGFIIFLVIGLFMKKSIKEITIYRALGQNNMKIIGQFCGEILIVILISLVGIRISAPVSSEWISEKIIGNISVEEKEETDDFDYFENGQYILDPNQIEENDIVNSIAIEVTNVEYYFCSGYILIISLISCVYNITKILKTKIKDILL